MRKTTGRIGRLSGVIAAGVAIVGTGSGVMAASYSAFSSTTANPGNSWSTGSVVLTDDDGGAAMFTGTNQQQNASDVRCIKVTSTGTLPSTVKLHSTAFSETNSLGSHVRLTIGIGTAASTGAFADCSGYVPGTNLYTGTLAGFHTAHGAGFGTGLSTGWSPAGGTVSPSESRVFRFEWSYDSTTPQGSTATDTFNWEAQGN